MPTFDLMAAMADLAAISPGTPSRFQQLMTELLAEHDREVQLLKQQKIELQEQIISLDMAGHEREERELPELETSDEAAPFLEEPSTEHPLRQEANLEMLPGPPTVTIECLPEGHHAKAEAEVEPASASRPSSPARARPRARLAPEPLEPRETFKPSNPEGEPVRLSQTSDQVEVVRAIAYTLQLPGSALPGEVDTAKGQMVVTVKCGEMTGDIPTAAALRQDGPQEAELPNQISSDETWATAWDNTGGEVVLHVPRSMLDKSIPFDVQTAGSAIHIASGMMQLNSERQQWTLNCGGFLESEIHVEKAKTPPGTMRRASTTTRARIVERLERLFDVKDGAAKVVMPADLGLAMRNAGVLNAKSSKRQSTKFESRLAPEDLDEVVIELKRISQKTMAKGKPRKLVSLQPVISWSSFVECMQMENLPTFTSGHAALHLFIVQQELLGDEMKATGTSQALLMAYEKAKKPISTFQRWVRVVTALSTAAIIVSFAFMGISLDTDPDWPGWIILDSVCAVIFVAEVVVKSYVITPSVYFCGRDYVWNLFDVGLSLVAVTEIILSVLFASEGAQTRAALALRGLRLARMARLAKLMRMPLLEELANLISGFVISVRSLFWVMIFLWLIVYVIALGFRAGVQTVSESTPDRCGYGDFYNWKYRDINNLADDEETEPPLPPGCKLHYMYGVEFCGTVFGCMFSIFRCMISECTSKGGRSLTMIFSDGFGIQFDVFYAAAMVVVLFGLFNIITAIFVEATLNGLKENEVQRRYAKAYETNYMTEQLAKLVMTVSTQVQKLRSRTALPAILGLRESPTNAFETFGRGETYLSEEEFNQLVRQPDVRLILNDLDVSVEPRPGIFDAFNTEPDGTVSLSELVSGLMRLRGDLHKVDMVIAQMSLDHMQKQIADIRKAAVESKLRKTRSEKKGPVQVRVLATRSAMPKAVAAPQNAVSQP